MKPASHRRASTLIELLVTLTLVGVMCGVALMAARKVDPIDHAAPARMLDDSARRAASEARAITISARHDSTTLTATLNPDGSVTADSTLHVDPLTTRPDHAR